MNLRINATLTALAAALILGTLAGADSGFVPLSTMSTASRAPSAATASATPAALNPTSAPTSDLECAKNQDELKTSPLIQQVLGKNYNPFVKWTAESYGVSLAPISSKAPDRMLLNVGMGHMIGLADIPMEIEICAETEKGKVVAFLTDNGKKIYFDDKHGNNITLTDPKHPDRPTVLERAEAAQ
jgi:hypothetical protein